MLPVVLHLSRHISLLELLSLGCIHKPNDLAYVHKLLLNNANQGVLVLLRQYARSCLLSLLLLGSLNLRSLFRCTVLPLLLLFASYFVLFPGGALAAHRAVLDGFAGRAELHLPLALPTLIAATSFHFK